MTKTEFLLYEFAQYSIQAGLATRNAENAIYLSDVGNASTSGRSALRNSIRNRLMLLGTKYESQKVSEAEHIAHIHTFVNETSTSFRSILKDGNFRFGIAQKILNLFLKYLWSSRVISETVHCPIDRIIKERLISLDSNIRLVDWTSMTREEEYLEYIRAIEIHSRAEGITIGEWELKNWKRR